MHNHMIISRRHFLRPAVLAVLLLLFAFALGNGIRFPAATAQAGAAAPYVVDLTGGYRVQPLLTVGEEVPRLIGDFGAYTAGDGTFALAGKPDGLGVYEGEDAYYVFVNHEISSGQLSKISAAGADRIDGARVSVFQFTKAWQIVGGTNLIDTAVADGATYTLDLASGNYVEENGAVLNAASGPNFSRFCSGTLATAGFVDGNGDPTPVWFTAEEKGAPGRGWAVFAGGTALALDGLGRYSKEQVYPASQYRAANAGVTVLLSTEDTPDGEIYLFVGRQTAADPNGFGDGDLYVLRAEDSQGNVYAYETIPEGVPVHGVWTPVPQAIALADGATLSAWVNDGQRSTNFRRQITPAPFTSPPRATTAPRRA
jgi:glycerophosphoryl diester phosphodiesterase